MISKDMEKGKDKGSVCLKKKHKHTKFKKKLNPWHLSDENVIVASLERHKALHLSAAEAYIP